VFQAAMEITKLPLSVIMWSGIILGALLAAFGIMPVLTKFGGGGSAVMLLGAGELAYNIGAFAGAGMWQAGMSLLAIFICIILGVFLVGVLAALVYLSKNKQTAQE